MYYKILIILLLLLLVGCTSPSPNVLTIIDKDINGNIIQRKEVVLQSRVSDSMVSQVGLSAIKDELLVNYLPDIPANVVERTFIITLTNTGNVPIMMEIEKSNLEVR